MSACDGPIKIGDIIEEAKTALVQLTVIIQATSGRTISIVGDGGSGFMRKLILMAVPCVFLLTACGGSQSYHSSDNSTYSSSRSPHYNYPANDSYEAYSTSARGGPPFGNYPVNGSAICTTG